MKFLTKTLTVYFWLVFVLLSFFVSFLLLSNMYYSDVGIHLLLATTLYLTLIERPSDIEYFNNTIKLKGFWSLFFIKFHWEKRISLFSYIMQIVALSLFLGVLTELGLFIASYVGKIYISEYILEVINKVYFIVFIVLIVFNAFFIIIRDWKIKYL